MRKHGLLVKLFAALIGLAFLMPSGIAEAKKRKKKVSAKQPAPLTTPLKLRPRGLKFGDKAKKVVRVYNRVIEGDFKKKMKAASPGVEMQRLNYTISQKKQEFRLSWQDFDGKPTGLDATPMKYEYTHNNREGYMEAKRRGKHRYLFFIRGKFWKMIDVYKLNEKSKWGVNFEQAVETIQKKLGVDGRPLKADESVGRENREVDFADGKVHLRVVDWGKRLALIYVDKATESNLANLRKKKKGNEGAVDPSVKAVMRDTSKDPRVNPKAQTRK